MTRTEFLTAASAAAVECSRASGFPAGITVAQAALESAWGRSRLSREANNYFGIKAHGGLPDIEMSTTEVRHGEAVRCSARFARYGSMQACFADRDRIIATLACYADARVAKRDPEAFLCTLAVHWATDPDYADKVLQVYRKYHLEELDKLARS